MGGWRGAVVGGLGAAMLLALVLSLCTDGEAALRQGERPAPRAPAAGDGGAEHTDAILREAAASADPAAAEEPAAEPGAAADDVPPPDTHELQQWIAALCDDGIRGNATVAVMALRQAGRAAIPPLQQTLGSRDRQQRLLAAEILRQLDAEAIPPLLEVGVESLGQEACAELQSTLACDCAANATRWLAQHAAAARPPLLRGLGAADPQQRFLSAFLLALGGGTGDLGPIVRELAEHLADNDIAGDALMAAHGLYRLGPRALPALQVWRPYGDGQAQGLIDLIALDLRDPPRDPPALRARRRLHRVTDVYLDPVLHFDVHRSRVAVW